MSTSEERLAELKTQVSYEPRGQPVENCTHLSMNESWNSELPAGLFELTGLKGLSSFQGYYTSLTPDISKLTTLESISFHRNRLSSLPAEVSLLTGLTYLGLADNPIEQLPVEVTALTKLSVLDLYNAMGNVKVKRVPRGITNLPCWTNPSGRFGTLSDAEAQGKLALYD